LQIDCVGSLTIVGGSLTSDSFIKLTASDALYFDKITITAPNITLTGNTISSSTSTKFDTLNINLTANGKPTLTCPFSGHLSGSTVTVLNSKGLTLTWVDNATNVGRGCDLNAIGGTGAVITNSGVLYPGGAITLSSGQCSSTGVPSVFKMVESGTRYCAGFKSAFHQVRFLRTTAECHTAPSSFEIAPTQDFPSDSSTQSKAAECSNINTSKSSCVLYEATGGNSNSSQPYAGRLAVKWGRNGEISRLSGHIIEKSLDGCHSESTLKFIKKIRQPN
jgi:hypothetical protein